MTIITIAMTHVTVTKYNTTVVSFYQPRKMSSKHNKTIRATNNFKQATVQNYRTRTYTLATRRWSWIGHVFRQKYNNISKTST